MRMRLGFLVIGLLGFAMTAGAEEVPPPTSGCPAPGDWPVFGSASYEQLNVYNQCFSATKNWEYTGLGDHRINAPGNVHVTFSSALAGGISSVKVSGQEYLHSGGHGAAFGYNIHPTPPSSDYCGTDDPACVSTECYNPTEHGNMADDRRDVNGYPVNPAPNGQIYPGQLHGPSTSAIWIDPTYWKSGPATAPTAHEWFRSISRLAYYVPFAPAPSPWRGFKNCSAPYPNLSPHNLGLSRYVLDKLVRLGPVRQGTYVLAGGLLPILSFNATLTIESGEHTSPKFNTVLMAYLLRGFDTYYRAPLGCINKDCLVPITPAELANENHGVASYDPLIVAKGLDYAMGVFAVKATGSGSHSEPYYFASYNAAGDVRGLQVTYNADNVTPPGTINYKAYYVMANLDWTAYALNELRNHSNIEWYPPIP